MTVVSAESHGSGDSDATPDQRAGPLTRTVRTFLLAIAWLAANSVLAQQPTEGLVAYRPFDEFNGQRHFGRFRTRNDLIVTASLQVSWRAKYRLEMTELTFRALHRFESPALPKP